MAERDRQLNTIKTRLQGAPQKSASNYEGAKNIATIFSALAIPIVLTVAGYFIQRQLADEGIKKDYVAIAAGILKENPANQEPELRVWAVKVLDDNAPVPFSKKARSGLLSGPINYVPLWPAFRGAPQGCMVRSKAKDQLNPGISVLVKDMPDLAHQALYDRLRGFLQLVIDDHEEHQKSEARLTCLQDMMDLLEKSDIEWRKTVGAKSSKELIEEHDRRVLAEKAAAKASGAVSSPPSLAKKVK